MMINAARNHWILAALAVAAFLANSARADQTAIAFDADRFWSTYGGAGNFGWQFMARSDIQVSSLGLYDSPSLFGSGFPGDGLLDSHAIGIWDVADPSIPLVSALIPTGTGAPLLNGFRFVNTAPVTLTANHEYVIAALYPSQDLISQDFTTGSINNPDFVLTVSPGIEFGGYRYNSNLNILAFPENYVPGLLLDFGPNFRFTVVPEPSSVTLILLGFMALLLSCTLPIRLSKGNKRDIANRGRRMHGWGNLVAQPRAAADADQGPRFICLRCSPVRGRVR